MLRIQCIFLHQAYKTLDLCISQLFKPLFYYNTVLILKLHYIAYCSNRRQLQHIQPFLAVNPIFFKKYLDQLISHHSAADLTERIFTVFSLGIDNGVCRRHDLRFRNLIYLNIMVICYHYRHSQFFCFCDLVNSSNSIITGKYHVDAVCSRLFNNMFINTITVFDTLRYYIINFCAYTAKSFVENAGRTHTINIIISYDPDPGTGSNLFF